MPPRRAPVQLGFRTVPRRSKGSICVRTEPLAHNANQDIAMIDNSECFLRIRAVLAKTGLSRSTLYRKMDSGNFPRQIKIAERCRAWRSSAVDAWLRNPVFYHVTDVAS